VLSQNSVDASFSAGERHTRGIAVEF